MTWYFFSDEWNVSVNVIVIVIVVVIKIIVLKISGINKAVANLQIDRYEKQVGHRFDTVNSTSDIYETCHHGSILDHGPSILGSIEFKDYDLYDDDDDDDDDDTNIPFVREEMPSLPSQRGKEEAALLRKKIRKLGKKLAAIIHHHKAPPE